MSDKPPIAKRCVPDLLAAGLLLGLIFAFLLPLLARRSPAVVDDCAVETLPGLIATARTLQSGAIPLWDFCTFAGAKPPYADNAYLIFYLPMYPLFLLADTSNASQCHLLLMLIPLALHLMWAALGAYWFGRLALQLPPPAALLTGLVYGLSPEMGFQLVSTPVAVTLSHLPWCMLALTLFLQRGGADRWLLVSLLAALMSTAGNPNYLIRAYFTLAVTAVLLWALQLWQQRREPGRFGGWQRAAGRLAAAAGALAMSIGLTAFAWAGTLEAAGWIEEAIPLSAGTAAWFTNYSSMHPMNLVSLFIPGFYGDLTCQHVWGVGRLNLNNATPAGGMFAMVAVLGAVLAGGGPAVRRRWTWAALVLLVASLLTMLGGYTPVFRGLCAVLPWFFRFPHPVYYRFIQCWAVAVLAGIGVAGLLGDGPSGASRHGWRRACSLAVILAVGGAAIALAWGHDGRWFSPSGLATVISENHWRWFLAVPAAYTVLAAAVLAASSYWFSPRRLAWVLTGGIALESLAVASGMFYCVPRRFDALAHPSIGVAGSFRRPEEDWLYRELVPFWREVAGQNAGRCAGACSIFDNLAWYVDGRALGGYSAKPLIPWYRQMLDRISLGTSEREWKYVPLQLLKNMNVRYIVTGTRRYRLRLSQKTPHFGITELKDPLPYAYVQDRVVPLPLDKQLEMLLHSDLRRAAYVVPNVARTLPDQPKSQSVPAVSTQERFVRLQQANPVGRVDQSRGNRMTIELQLQQPAMLIIAECWHSGWTARVDGRPAPVHRVNFLQQGIWLESGSHRVQLQFFPPSVSYGLAVSLVSGLAALVVFLAAVWSHRKSRR